MSLPNLHGTAVVLGDRGVLITGPSGAGKTALALALVDAFQARGRFARLVCDDQCWVHAAQGSLVVSAPETIAGLAEIHGLRPVEMRFEPRAVIDLAVLLADADTAPRFQEIGVQTIAGIDVPALTLGAGKARANVGAILAQLCAGRS